jgi:3-hydroxybutyryl-CoA dehydrogenase
MAIKKIMVVGAGNMGAGIAQQCAQNGFEAVISDISLELSNAGLARIEKGLAGRVAKGKTTQAERPRPRKTPLCHAYLFRAISALPRTSIS